MLTLANRVTTRQVLVVLFGSIMLAASAQVALPAWPVPATLQSLAILLLGALAGPRQAVAAVLLYIAEGAAGLPVFAAGSAGPLVLMGPTAGYLLGYVFSAWIAGYARGGVVRQALILSAAHLAMFIPGVLWLTQFTGMERAFMLGFLVFLPATVVKTALALAVVRGVRRTA